MKEFRSIKHLVIDNSVTELKEEELGDAELTTGKLHRYEMRGLRRWYVVLYLACGLFATLVGLCNFLGVGGLSHFRGALPEPLGMIAMFAAICLLLGVLTWIDILKSSVTTYPDRIVFRTFPFYQPVTIASDQVSRLQTFAPRKTLGNGSDPSLVVCSGFRRFEIDRSISDWDDLRDELQTLTGKQIKV